MADLGFPERGGRSLEERSGVLYLPRPSLWRIVWAKPVVVCVVDTDMVRWWNKKWWTGNLWGYWKITNQNNCEFLLFNISYNITLSETMHLWSATDNIKEYVNFYGSSYNLTASSENAQLQLRLALHWGVHWILIITDWRLSEFSH